MRYIISSLKLLKSLEALSGVIGGADNIRCIVQEEDSPRSGNDGIVDPKTIIEDGADTPLKMHLENHTEESTSNNKEPQRSQELAELINNEIEQLETSAEEIPKSVGMFSIKSANDTLIDAKQRPDPYPLWLSLWYEGEVCCLFADSNLGKSIYAVQIAESIAHHQKVLYFDFELSDKQFQLRYTSSDGELYQFPPNLYRVDIDNEALNVDDFEDNLIRNIESAGIETGAKVLIIDNLTWI